MDYSELLTSFQSTGLQAQNVKESINIINELIEDRNSSPNVKVFLGYTSNMISCGMRETIRYLCEHKMVDAIVTTCGAIEEDIMKCYLPAYIGKFRNNDS